MSDPALLRVPPHSIEAEVSLLGAMLLDPAAVGEAGALVRASDFYRQTNGRIFDAARGLYERGEPVDALLLARECERLGILDAVGGRDYLAHLAGSVEKAANAAHYARIVREKSLARGLIGAALEIQRGAYDEEGRGDELLERAESSLFALRSGADSLAVVGGNETVETLRAEWGQGASDAVAVPTGFADLDAMTGGLRAGQLVVVAGATGAGKSTVALNIARRAIEAGRPVLLFSLEMSKEEVTRNVLAAAANVHTTRLHDPKRLSPFDRDALDEAAKALGGLRALRIHDDPSVTPLRMRAIARRERVARGIELVVVDYVQLVQPGTDGRRSDSREQDVAAVSRALKGLARELGVPVIALAQVNRGPDSRDDHRPRLSDLRESSAIAHDADLVLGVFRRDYYEPDEPSARGVLELLVLKQRNGPTGPVRLAYRKEIAWLGDLAQSAGTAS